jgi:glycine C-acetyltransferase
MKEWLAHRARPLLFSTYLPPSVIGPLLEAVKMLSESDEYTKACWDNANYFKAKMKEANFNIGHSETPITPVFIGDEAKTVLFSKTLLKEGVYVSPIIFPTVPKGLGRVRVMVSASHTKEQLNLAIDAFIRVKNQMGL